MKKSSLPSTITFAVRESLYGRKGWMLMPHAAAGQSVGPGVTTNLIYFVFCKGMPKFGIWLWLLSGYESIKMWKAKQLNNRVGDHTCLASDMRQIHQKDLEKIYDQLNSMELQGEEIPETITVKLSHRWPPPCWSLKISTNPINCNRTCPYIPAEYFIPMFLFG